MQIWNNILMNKEVFIHLLSLLIFSSLFFLGESIPVFLNSKDSDDNQAGLINPTKPEIPTVGHQYLACIYDDLKIVDCLVEIGWDEADELVKTANARRKSVV